MTAANSDTRAATGGHSIWTNARFDERATAALSDGIRPHRLIVAASQSTDVLAAGASDPAVRQADIAFGQPNPADCLQSDRLRWVAVTTAGYTRFDTTEIREAFRQRGVALTNSSAVFSEPCAQHVLGMILGQGRQLFASHRDQLTDRAWRYAERRAASTLLNGQTVLLLGYGAIGRRLAELLAPFGVALYAVRRQRRSERGIRIVPEEELTRVLPLADHVVNILPDNEATRNFVNARRLGWFKPGAIFYNIGRGTTVDQRALIAALESKRLGAAHLDVMEPEPLPPDHPLWFAPNCHITAHTAGGRRDQDAALVRHFLSNLAAFGAGNPLTDRVI